MSSPNFATAQNDVPSYLNVGPFVDKVVYKIIPNEDQRILAIQAGEIEMDTSPISSAWIPTLSADPDIELYEGVRNGYAHITIDCSKYPLNISGLRRAFAFAFDKTRVTNEVYDGFSVEHDSLVPSPSHWCIEEDLGWHYYTNQSDIGNQILDALNFTIDSGSGFRLAPDGSPFDIVIEYPSTSPEIAGGTAEIGVETLSSLHIDSEARAVDYSEYIHRCGNNLNFDMFCYSLNFGSDDVDWLAYEYWGEWVDVPYQNPTNFRNATYDSWRNQLLYGITYDEVYEAAAEMQRILHYNVPRLVVAVETHRYMYRIDEFTGHVPDKAQHISGTWTLRQIHRIDGIWGATVSIGIAQEPDSFNIFVSNSPYSRAIFREFWPSLYKWSPDLTPHPELAQEVKVETHYENSTVPDGHTRYTFDIIRNATWTDGTNITAEDVAFTLNYSYESGAYGNPAATDLGDLEAAYTVSPYRVVIEFNRESYWHFSNFAFDYIIPKHIFNDEDGIGYDGWNTWNPVFDPAEPHVTSGPFVITDYDSGEFYEITINPDFAYAICGCNYPPWWWNSTSPELPGSTPIASQVPISPMTLTSVAIAGISSIVIIVMVIEIFRHDGIE
jgi:ABC-type transport system substrate-binding protein